MASEASAPARRESWRTTLVRWRFNLFLALATSGTRLTFISDDWHEARLTVALNWRTRNYRGTIFGGTLYAALDPIYMIMVVRNLGTDYSVWDTRATVHFKKAGRGKLYARFVLEDAELEAIRRLAAEGKPVERQYDAVLTDQDGTVHVLVEKTIYIRRRDPNRDHGKDHVSSMLKMR